MVTNIYLHNSGEFELDFAPQHMLWLVMNGKRGSLEVSLPEIRAGSFHLHSGSHAGTVLVAERFSIRLRPCPG